MSKRILTIAGILSVLILVLSNCTSRNKVSQESVNHISGKPSNYDSPENNYKNFCADCHGSKMKDFIKRKWTNGNLKSDLVNSIQNGIVNKGMPAYAVTFSEKELEELAEYILTVSNDPVEIENHASNLFQSKDYQLYTETVVDGIEAPWGLKVTKDGTIFFTEKKGTLNVKRTDGSISTIKNVPAVYTKAWQGGMLDVTLHPNFENNQYLYLSYSKENPIGRGATTAVVRGKLVDDELKEVTEIFEAFPYSEKIYHFGCRLVFDDKGYLYISMGDRGERDKHPQSLMSSCGKILRLHDDGRIPVDNPFYDKEDCIQSIWAYGIRNPQGLIFDEVSKTVWEHEHGPKGGDELNIIEKGANYGWPIVSYGINYNGTSFTDITTRADFKPPITYWVPSIAPSGMAMIKGNNYPKWTSDILTGSLKFNYVSRVKLDGAKVVEEEKILEDIGRVRSIEMGADGFLYVGVEKPGKILKVTVR